MAVKNIILFVVASFLFGCESAFVDTLPKCGMNDGDCHRDVVQSVLRDIGKTGIAEYNIPPIDPIDLKNIEINLLGIIDITLENGVAKGIKDCKVIRFTTSMEDGHASMELLCDINVKGHFKFFSNNTMIQTLLGGEMIYGDGNTKIKIENLKIIFDYYFDIERRNGETYIKCKFDNTIYSYDIGNMNIGIRDMNIRNTIIEKDQSALIERMINENWRLIMSMFGKTIMDKAMEYVYDYTHSFFDNVPTKYYISDDLSNYVTN